MKAKLLNCIFILLAIVVMAGCKTAVIKPALSYTGVWNATYTMHSASFADNYKIYNWVAKLTISSNGTAQALHQPGNPIFPDTAVTENFKWGIVDDHTIFMNSQNWSVTANMQYEVLAYGSNYISLDGFDDQYQYWQLTLRK